LRYPASPEAGKDVIKTSEWALVATKAPRHKKPTPFNIAVLIPLSCFSRSWILPYPHLTTKGLDQIKSSMDGLDI